MSQNACKLAKPEAVLDIVKDIKDLLRQRRPIFDTQVHVSFTFRPYLSKFKLFPTSITIRKYL